jgi:hypothetical protein
MQRINNAGQIVGSFGGGVTSDGFLYSGGSFTQIDVPGATSTEAHGINNAGQIVGFFISNTEQLHDHLRANCHKGVLARSSV